VVLLEDSAALIGLAFAFAGVGLSVLTHNEAWDGGGSVAIGLLLAGVAVVVARETKSLLIGEAASPAAERTIVQALENGPEVERVIHMRTVHLSPDSLLVAAKVAVRAGDSATTVVRGIDAAESRSGPRCRSRTSSTWNRTSTRRRRRTRPIRPSRSSSAPWSTPESAARSRPHRSPGPPPRRAQ